MAWHKEAGVEFNDSPSRFEAASAFSQSNRQHRQLAGPYHHKNKAHLPYWVVGTHGHPDTQAVVAMLWKWLSEPKRGQAHSAMAKAIPYYLGRSVWGKGRSVLSMQSVQEIRQSHQTVQTDRQRVPRGWMAETAKKYGINQNTLNAICGGRGYV